MIGSVSPTASPSPGRAVIGRVISISGAYARLHLIAQAPANQDDNTTVGKFAGVIVSARTVIIGLISEVKEEFDQAVPESRSSIAQLELIGEIKIPAAGQPHFQRGINTYPKIGDSALLMNEAELRLIYGGAASGRAHIGNLQQNNNIGVHINIDDLVSRHFAILGSTGVGKSSGVAVVLDRILSVRPNLRIFLIDPHNEYAPCFGDKAQVFSPHNLRLPFWLFNFEETMEAFFGGRSGSEEETEILAEVIPLAKAAYLQYRATERSPLAKRRDTRAAGFTADTPVPYRIEDLISLLDERMGKLENRSSRLVYHKLISRIGTVRANPRYGFMFENANLGGDTMIEILAHLFRLAPEGKPMAIMQLAGFPAEVIDSVVSVLCRMAFDFGLWSDGAAPMLLVCEEAHRYAPADFALGFGPTRRALSRIAKEGRKYGVYLGLVTQRPSEIDPTILSQCNTLFVMRLSNDRDQSYVRSATSDATANMLSFLPSLGTREVIAFGPGIALPSRMQFIELPAAMRPNSEAGGNSRSDGGAAMTRELIGSVIERWRSASLSHRTGFEDTAESVTVSQQPAPPLVPSTSSARQSSPAEPAHQGLLKRPLESVLTGTPQLHGSVAGSRLRNG